MKHFRVWQEEQVQATDSEMPTPEDQSYYQTNLASKLMKRLEWLTNELGSQNLNLVKKGFVLEAVMKALGFQNPAQALRVVNNIKMMMQKQQQQPNQPNQQMPNQPNQQPNQQMPNQQMSNQQIPQQ